MQQEAAQAVDACHADSTEVLPDLFHDLIQSIVSALEARDPHTAEHSLRVGDMVERTCLLMGLPGKEATVIHMAAHVHDIGKIGMPDTVLLRKSRLTVDEHVMLRDHARIGAEILGGCPSLADVACIVLHHHERWDGSGYPDGLSGDQIPLGSRIIAVCDSIDAMLGKRLYRKALSEQDCRQEVLVNKGTIYDPVIAWFVLEHWDEIVGPINFRHSDKGDDDACRVLHCSVPFPMGLEHSA